jgi:hypothetical protein
MQGCCYILIMMLTVSPLGCPENGHFYYCLSTLANLTLIILFLKMLKFSKNISSKSKNIVKENSEYLGIFHFLKLFFQN